MTMYCLKYIKFGHNHEMKLIGENSHVSNVPQNVRRAENREEEKKRMGVLNFSFLPQCSHSNKHKC